MNAVNYQVKVTGLPSPSGKIPVKALMELLHGLTECAERGLRLAIEGASVKTGRTPVWLDKAVNFTFSGLKKGSTVLQLEAPTLGTAIGTELSQQDFWLQPPSPDDTALSLVSRSVQDTTAENLESDFYDAGVLKSLLDLKPLLKTQAKMVEVSAKDRPKEHIRLTMEEMAKAERLKVKTPDPQAFIVSGHLDAIQHSRKRFQLVLSDGQLVPGRIDEEFVSAEKLREFWGKPVTVKGTVHFKPSSRIQLLEAQMIKPKEAGDEVFEEMPSAQGEATFVAEAFQSANKRDWLKEVWGKWPGEESIEELLEGLKR